MHKISIQLYHYDYAYELKHLTSIFLSINQSVSQQVLKKILNLFKLNQRHSF